VVREARQVRALRTPARYRVLSGFQELGPCAVKDVAARVGRPAASLYYHVEGLVRAGLLRPAGRRRAARRDEALFAATAREIVLDPGQRTPGFIAALSSAYRAVLRACERSLGRALRAERGGAGRRRHAMVLETQARLAPEDLERVRAKLAALHRFAAARERRDAHRVTLVSVLVRADL
jgi:hypothetical protein